MTCKNTKNIAIFSIVSLFALTSICISNVYAEESRTYKMVGEITPVLTFTFRDGVETYEFPVFEMGENFVSNSGTSFSVEGTVTHSPLLHKAMDESYKYRFSNAAFDYQLKYFDVDVNFVKKGESVLTLDYDNCRIDNYQVETLDSNDYESYFKEVGFAIVDKIDFICSGITIPNNSQVMYKDKTYVDFGDSEFTFANNMRSALTFTYENGIEKIQFPVFNIISGYAESSENVVAEFQVEGVLEQYPLLYNAIEQSRKVSGLTTASNIKFDVLAEFTNGESTLWGIDYSTCRISDAQITTKTDKEEGFTGKSGFVLVHQLSFVCSGMKGIDMNYDELRGNTPSWSSNPLYNEYVEPIQNTDKDLSAITTFTFNNGIEKIEFSMFTQNEILSTLNTGDTRITGKSVYPTIELRGIVGDYPMLYNYVEQLRTLQGVSGTQSKELVDIDVDLVSGEETLRGFNYAKCRIIDYQISTSANSEESYVKNSFALENIFDFECQGYHPNNPVYDTMFKVEKANTQSSKDLRNTQDWRSDFISKRQ
ncbi:hypothetical protein [Nitrosopumilus sp.]|uniref:hypothetical protein n=1 Tax=Nitrosopumilus sp. TaxID=2024843 RepID=UPI00247BAB2F|nr:hypothetical protein [Nitrosopumilus sp.]MCV0431491.1 hypothetical protein [Nitrosopumilus sp.]